MSKRLDLTQGSMPRLITKLAVPICLGMLMHAVYSMADLYFVGRLGPHAVAAVSISGNAFFIMMGLSMILGTGGMALIAQAFGRKDYEEANRIFKQSLILSLSCGLAIAFIGIAIARPFVSFFGGHGDSLTWGVEYFQVFSISLTVLLLLFVVGSGFRGMGDTKTPMFIMMQSAVLNIILDPLLIFGLLGMPAMGVRGAAVASLVAQLYALAWYAHLIFIKGSHIQLSGSWRPDLVIIKRSLAIGIPSGLTMYFVGFNMMIGYRVVSGYGTAALASLGIGFRIIQSCYLPSMGIAAAVAAAVGQNYGARIYSRIRQSIDFGLRSTTCIMILGTAVCCIFSAGLIDLFSKDQEVIRYGIIYLTITSLTNPAVGMLMVISSSFQGLGKTYPAFVSAAIDTGLFALLVLTLPGYFGWGIQAIWWIKAIATVFELALVSFWLKIFLRDIRNDLALTTISR
ncbi:MAG: MATE family efflux transporter [Deltaproteobacteria bacterium]|nr:MATE family efflux transporter [Deltaproteobacteria bacterium]